MAVLDPKPYSEFASFPFLGFSADAGSALLFAKGPGIIR